MRRLSRSFSCAIRGLFHSISRERNMKIHLLAAVVAIGIGFILDVSRIEWAILILSIFMVLSAETINSAIEEAVDLITKDHHPLAGIAKDLAAGGVLLTAINAVIIAILIFGSRLISR